MMGRERSKPLYYRSKDANEVSLLYGGKYEFRVRMVDATNGGPVLDDERILPGESPISRVHFKRFVPPGPVYWPERDPNPQDATLTQYTITRPRLDLPAGIIYSISQR